MASVAHQGSAETIAQFERYVIPNYRRYPVCLVRGEGSYIWDAEGNRYLDFFPGWGCNLLGHCPPRVVEAVREQVGQLIHVPNTWYMEAQGAFAQALSERSLRRPGLLLQQRRRGQRGGHQARPAARPRPGRYKIVTMEDGFHGRTYARAQRHGPAEVSRRASSRWSPASRYVPFDDLDAVAAAIDGQTAAVLVEPIQGEGGINIPPAGYLAGLRELCDERGVLLILDEVQTGLGRTGEWFAYQHSGDRARRPDLRQGAGRRRRGRGDDGQGRGRRDAQAGDARQHLRRQPDRLPGRPGGRSRRSRRTGSCDAAGAIGERFRGHFQALRDERPDLVRDDPHPRGHDRRWT